eukprot:TRINITY_DN12357_c0_g1_i1.p1 TRINITY_DN12357_c0_g1~~TRINITY_DN12357_c0_g1_i1.p1  ORF type:complete len:833 (+),score=74.92 TRINITY_DN12357_c0_g1_i1:111-2609(+)
MRSLLLLLPFAAVACLAWPGEAAVLDVQDADELHAFLRRGVAQYSLSTVSTSKLWDAGQSVGLPEWSLSLDTPTGMEHISLKRNQLVSPSFQRIRLDGDGSAADTVEMKSLGCFYIGRTHLGHRAVGDSCSEAGIHLEIDHEYDRIIVEPLVSHIRSRANSSVLELRNVRAQQHIAYYAGDATERGLTRQLERKCGAASSDGVTAANVLEGMLAGVVKRHVEEAESSRTKYMDLLLVEDYSWLLSINFDFEQSALTLFRIVNQAQGFFNDLTPTIQLRIIFLGYFEDEPSWFGSGDGGTTLSGFVEEWAEALLSSTDCDALHLFTADSVNLAGLASPQISVCTMYPGAALTTIEGPNSEFPNFYERFELATTFAHELGHQLGFPHPFDALSPITGSDCTTPWAVMGYGTFNTSVAKLAPNSTFSECTQEWWELVQGQLEYNCLENDARDNSAILFPESDVSVLCGDGIVDYEYGEECDVPHWLEIDPLQPHCASTCKLIRGFECADANGECCKDGRLLPAGTPCGPQSGVDFCDQRDTCNGVHSFCPDMVKEPGTVCTDAGGDSNTCWEGQCLPNLDMLCDHWYPNTTYLGLNSSSTCGGIICADVNATLFSIDGYVFDGLVPDAGCGAGEVCFHPKFTDYSACTAKKEAAVNFFWSFGAPTEPCKGADGVCAFTRDVSCVTSHGIAVENALCPQAIPHPTEFTTLDECVMCVLRNVRVEPWPALDDLVIDGLAISLSSRVRFKVSAPGAFVLELSDIVLSEGAEVASIVAQRGGGSSRSVEQVHAASSVWAVDVDSSCEREVTLTVGSASATIKPLSNCLRSVLSFGACPR